MTDLDNNGVAEVAAVSDAVPEPLAMDQALIQLDLELPEAEALHQWLLKATSEGVSALDDPLVSATLKKLSHSLDYIHTVSTVRDELEQSGFDTQGMSDEQVADLTRRIREANNLRVH